MNDKERHLIKEVIKAFVENQWCLSPEGIWGFLHRHGESVEFEKVFAVFREIMQKGG